MNEKGQYTPGPWKQNGLLVTDKYGEPVAHCTRYHGQTPKPDVAKANAQLIAVAPELLEAVKGILAGFEAQVFVRNIDGDGDPGWAMKMVRYLQALARGQRAIEKAESHAEE